MKRRAHHDPKLAVAYLRRSKEQAGGTLGIEAQRDMVEAWARRELVTILAAYVDDGVSGGLPLARRPALLEALADVREHSAGVLVVAKRDRVARDVAIAIEIGRAVNLHGAILVSADGTGNGSDPHAALQRTMLDSFAEYERAMIGARTRAALARKRVRGEYAGGGAPYGQTAVNGRLEPNEAERAVIARIVAMHARGLRVSEIVRTLTRSGVRNREGNPLHRKSVERILHGST